MKNLFIALIFGFISLSLFGQEVPTESKTTFDDVSLNQSLFDLKGSSTTVGAIFEQYKGKIIFLDLWASWCSDCIKGLPRLKEVQSKYTDMVYLFFSLDRNENAWKRGIEKFNIQGEHYWFSTGWKNGFTNYIGLNWIPRYILIDQTGNIAHYYAVHADDTKLLSKIEELMASSTVK